MIYIVAHNYVKPGMVDAFKKRAQELIISSRMEEECSFYDLTQDDRHPYVLTFIEGWLSQEGLDHHNASAHFLTIVPDLKAMCEKEGLVVKYRSF